MFNRKPTVEDLAWWAHELVHINQYRRWGIEGFARRYATNYQAIEREAEAMEHLVQEELGVDR